MSERRQFTCTGCNKVIYDLGDMWTVRITIENFFKDGLETEATLCHHICLKCQPVWMERLSSFDAERDEQSKRWYLEYMKEVKL